VEEAWVRLGVENAQAQARLDPESGAMALPVGGGYAVFMGVGSPLSQVQGVGLYGDRPKPQNPNLTLRREDCRAESPSSRQVGAHGDPPSRSDRLLQQVGVSRSDWAGVGSRPSSAGHAAIPGASTGAWTLAVFNSSWIKPQKSFRGMANPRC
jgi:hypothetical protein